MNLPRSIAFTRSTFCSRVRDATDELREHLLRWPENQVLNSMQRHDLKQAHMMLTEILEREDDR